MKKILLVLMPILVISVYLLSCDKETNPPQKLPAVQKIRYSPTKNWELAENSILQIPIVFDQKLKPEFENFESDSNVVVTCRVRFKDLKVDRLLPYVETGLNGTKYYFFSLAGGKPKIFFHFTGKCDLTSGGGAVPALPVESITIVYERMDHFP